MGIEDMDITGKGAVGGLVGTNTGSVSNCYATGSVTAKDEQAGGLVGTNTGSVEQSYATVSVTAEKEQAGGLVGRNEGSVENCYATGSVIAKDEQAGGLVGRNDGAGASVTRCYSTGSVSGGEQIGGLVGTNDKGSVSNSFWDTQTSGRTTSSGGTGKTTAQMKTRSTFTNAGWTFPHVWWMMDTKTYPRLHIWDWKDLGEDNHTATTGEVDIRDGTRLQWNRDADFYYFRFRLSAAADVVSHTYGVLLNTDNSGPGEYNFTMATKGDGDPRLYQWGSPAADQWNTHTTYTSENLKVITTPWVSPQYFILFALPRDDIGDPMGLWPAKAATNVSHSAAFESSDHWLYTRNPEPAPSGGDYTEPANIPEFHTILVPVSVIFGLLVIFRKRRAAVPRSSAGPKPQEGEAEREMEMEMEMKSAG